MVEMLKGKVKGGVLYGDRIFPSMTNSTLEKYANMIAPIITGQ